MNRRTALFLDRDGVINIDRGHVHCREDFEFIEGIFGLCRHARDLGYRIFVITNQAGIGRGYYTEAVFHALTEWMCGVFRSEGVHIDKVYFCPFHAEHGIGRYKIDSPFRKPRPGMILQAASEFDIDLQNSVLLGDRESDIQAGTAAGIGCNLLFDRAMTTPPSTVETFRRVRSFSEVQNILAEGAVAGQGMHHRNTSTAR